MNTDGSGNIRLGNLHTIIFLLIICVGLLSLKSSGGERNSLKKPVPVNISLNQSSAISTSVLKVQVFQNSWISNKDYHKLLSFYRSPVLVNRNTEVKISCLNNERLQFVITPQSILRYHLFPPETDDPHC